MCVAGLRQNDIGTSLQSFRRHFLHFIGASVTGIWAANASLLLTDLRPNKDFDNFYPLNACSLFFVDPSGLTSLGQTTRPYKLHGNGTDYTLPNGLDVRFRTAPRKFINSLVR